MALGNFVAGHYSSTYQPQSGGAASLGLVEKGYTLSFSYAKELIQDSDAYGAMIIDAVYRGIANCFLQTTLMEWLAQSLLALTPYAAAPMPQTGAGYLGPGTIAQLDTNVAGTVVLTSTAGTPAASSPASLSITYAIMAEGFDSNWLLGPYHRKLPIRLRIYPFNAAGTIKYLTVT